MTKVFANFKKKFKNLRNRFALYFLIISMIPAGIVGVVTYQMSTTLIEEQKMSNLSNTLEKVINGVNEKVSEKETLGIKFYLDNYVQELLIQGKKKEDTIFQVMKLLFSNEYTDVNDIIFLCDKDGELYTNSMISPEEATEILMEGKEHLKKTRQTYEWMESKKINEMEVIPFIWEIDDIYSTNNDTKAYFVTGLQEELLQSIYTSYFKEEEGNIYVVNATNKILSSDRQELIGKNFFQTYKLDESMLNNSASYYREVKIEGEDYYLVTLEDDKRDWSYLYLLRKDIALSGMESVRLVSIAGIVLSFIISVLMSVVASAQIVRPIKELITTMQKVEKGDMQTRFEVPDIEEIAELGQIFNKMMQKLQDSMRQIYAVQKQRRDAEMKALVLQINPHFLYNTLSSIIWLTDADKKDEVIEMTSSLATLFRISISKGQEIVKIREEFEHVKSYIRIQQIRFENKFSCYVELDEDIAECYTLKVILQPLVENVINHALSDIDYQGIIVIKAKKEQNIIRITVMDNADGMTEEEIKALNDHLQESYTTGKEYGIGTSNVNNRIKLLFGSEYGLSFRKDGKNVIAEITIPIVTDEKELEK